MAGKYQHVVSLANGVALVQRAAPSDDHRGCDSRPPVSQGFVRAAAKRCRVTYSDDPMSAWITSELPAGTSGNGGMIITFADKARWLTDDPRGVFPDGATRDVLIGTSVGKSLPVGLDLLLVDEDAPAICWQGLRLIRKGRE